MKLALDATPLIEPTGGVCRYTKELTLALARQFPDDQFWLVSDQPFERLPVAPPNLRYAQGPRSVLERRWWLWGLQSELVRLKVDVFHGTDYAVPYLPVRPSVLTLHDISPWLDPAWHTAAERVRTRTPVLLRLGLATMVVTPSEAIRREAMQRFRLPPDRIVSIPLAASDLFRPVAGTPRTKPFILFVGTLEPRKNIRLLLQAWRQVRKRHDVDLLLAGRRRQDFHDLESEPGLHLLGTVPDELLPELYSSCVVSVYPSLHEGFGLPVLEAMQCGAAVITSQDSAVVEIGGGATVALDANDVKCWIEALTATLENSAWVADLRERSRRRAAEFSWSKTAKWTHEIYDEAVRRFRRK